MNILPKKSWHVRNKDNVARVRRDEAKALEEEQECARRKALAEQEARIRILREKAAGIKKAVDEAKWDLPQEPDESDEEKRDKPEEKQEEYQPLNTAFPAGKHINLFEDFEQKKTGSGANADYEKEKKKLQEDYEKKIGYLTYLGQSAPELAGVKPWYEKIPNKDAVSSKTLSQELTLQSNDPLLAMKDYLDKKTKAEDIFYNRDKPSSKKSKAKSRDRSKRRKHDKHHRHSDSSDDDLEHKRDRKRKHKDRTSKLELSSDNEKDQMPRKPTIEELRAVRMAREAAEKKRTLDLISKHQGFSSPARSVIDERNLSYNSGFGRNRDRY